MDDELVVRDIRTSELDGLLALYRDLHPSDDPLPQRAVLEQTWQAIQHDPAQIYLGGLFGDQLVAACNAAVIPNLTRGGRPYAVVENVVTAATHRKRGFGRALLGRMVERCKAAGCYKVMLMSAMTRSDQHAFYERVGFDRHAKQAFVIDLRRA